MLSILRSKESNFDRASGILSLNLISKSQEPPENTPNRTYLSKFQSTQTLFLRRCEIEFLPTQWTYQYLSNIKQVKTGTVDTRAVMGVNNTPIPERRRRSRLDLPEAGMRGSRLFVRDRKVPGTGKTTKRRKL